MHLLPRYYAQVEAGHKTIEVRTATSRRQAIAEGDTLVFHDRGSDRQLDVIAGPPRYTPPSQSCSAPRTSAASTPMPAPTNSCKLCAPSTRPSRKTWAS